MGKMVSNYKQCVYLVRTFYSNSFLLTVEKTKCVSTMFGQTGSSILHQAPASFVLSGTKERNLKLDTTPHPTASFLANTGTRDLTYKLG